MGEKDLIPKNNKKKKFDFKKIKKIQQILYAKQKHFYVVLRKVVHIIIYINY